MSLADSDLSYSLDSCNIETTAITGAFTDGDIITLPIAGGGTQQATFRSGPINYNRAYFEPDTPGTYDLEPGGIINNLTQAGTVPVSTTFPAYANGDFMEPDFGGRSGINPYTNLQGFLSGDTSTKLRGLFFGQSTFINNASGNPANHWCCVFDYENSAVSAYLIPGGQNRVRVFVSLGQITLSNAPAFPFSSEGVVYFGYRNDDDEAGTQNYNWYESFYDVFSGGGGRANFGLSYRTDISRFSQPRPNGTFDWDTVELTNVNESGKGRINENVIRVIGGANEHQGRVMSNADATFYKVDRYLGLPWKNGTPRVPPFPYGENANTGNPNTDTGEVFADGDI